MTAKLLITLGPRSLNRQVIQACDHHGIFLFRINLSHTSIEELEEKICIIRKYSDTPICLDSEGAQIRNQHMKNGEAYFEKGRLVTIHHETFEGDSENISFTPAYVAKELKVDDQIDIDFHSARLRIVEVNRNHCKAIVLNDGKVGSNKAADLSRLIDLPAITSKDEKAIEIGKQMGIQHFALSFAGCQEDVELVRSKAGKNCYIISKIESYNGLKNLYPILDSSDAILIDRGDLSRQIPIEKIPFLQRRIVASARAKEKEVFVATNLLESMVTTKNPTRAELNDVVSTLSMGANGLVLAAETAIGLYPVECVEIIKKLINQYERWTPNSNIDEILLN